MKICKDCGGLGSVPVDPKTPGNHKRCQACNGTGLKPETAASATKHDEHKTKNIQKEN